MQPTRVMVLLSSNARRGAEIEGLGLVEALRSRGIDASALALASTSSGTCLAVPVLGPGPLALSTLGRLRRETRGADIIIAYGSKTLPACALGLFGLRRPFVYRSIGDPRSWVRSGWHRRRTRLLMRRASGVVALWPEAKHSICDLYGVPAQTVSVIPNARSATDFCPPSEAARQEARRSLGLAEDARVVTFIGSIAPEKRLELAIEAMALAVPAHLLVVGDGPGLDDAREKAAVLADRVTFLGALSDVRPILAATDVLLSTSSTEGMPGALIEGAMCGVAAVATCVGAIPWLFEMGLRGSCVPTSADAAEIAEAVDATISQPNDCRERLTEICSWDAVLPSWLEVIESVARS